MDNEEYQDNVADEEAITNIVKLFYFIECHIGIKKR